MSPELLQPHALSARYEAKADRVVVDLTNGATFAFPPRLVEGLHDASPAEIAEVEVIGRGFGPALGDAGPRLAENLRHL